MKTILQLADIFLVSICLSSAALASDSDELEAKLREFLAAASTEAAHAEFWAEDLVYTSSNGTRFGKAEIMSGFDSAEPTNESPATIYSAEDVDIRLYDDTAIVAFKLVGTPTDAGVETTYYFNTGTFLKRDDNWQAVAWQATIIPADDK